MTDEEKLRRERESQQVVNAYHRVFTSEDGQRVLADIWKVFGLAMPILIPFLRDGGFDMLHAAKRDGQADVYRHIRAKLDAVPKGDNIEKPKKRNVLK